MWHPRRLFFFSFVDSTWRYSRLGVIDEDGIMVCHGSRLTLGAPLDSQGPLWFILEYFVDLLP